MIRSILSILFIFPFFASGNCADVFSSPNFNEGPAFHLFQEAVNARNQSHAPYSNYYVGAALSTANGKVYCGCNVENSAYGSTQCAEANAVGNMIVGGEKEIKSIVIVLKSQFKADKEILGTPCGNCRQILSEFANAHTKIHIYTPEEGYKKTYTMEELLPEAFTIGNNKIPDSKDRQLFKIF